jgi:hypothetical protein
MPGETLLIGFARAGALRARGPMVMLGASIISGSVFALNALVFGSVAAFALGLCVQLSVAAISFYTLVATASS